MIDENGNINIFDGRRDTSHMSQAEFRAYGMERLSVMVKLEEDAEQWLKERNTPLQQLVLETAKRHVKRCEEKYGVSRNDLCSNASY